MQQTMKKFWSADDGICELCGKEFPNRIPEAEMYHPETVDEEGSLVTHESCGKRRGMRYA